MLKIEILGWSIASNELVAMFDSDDIGRTNRFEVQVKFLMENPEVVAVSANISEFMEKLGDLERVRNVPLCYNEIKKYAAKRSPINNSVVMLRKSAVLAVGGYPQSFPVMEDYALWLKLLSKGHLLANIPQVLLDQRVGNGMVGKRRGWEYARLEARMYCFKREMGLSSGLMGVGIFILRFFSRLLPEFILRIIYKFMREKALRWEH